MRILLGTDGSDFSDRAIARCAQVIADPENSIVRIVSVYPEVISLDAFQGSIDYVEKVQAEARTHASNAVADAETQSRALFVESKPRIESETHPGAPDQVLIELAKAWPADMIIVGSHGRGFWGRITLGSVSDSLTHNAPCSVLVVR